LHLKFSESCLSENHPFTFLILIADLKWIISK
jgi:hypothetical protein